jgi:predicted Zn-dependent protease
MMTVSAVQATDPNSVTPIDRAFARFYNYDFANAQTILDEQIRAYPDDPLAYAVRAAGLLFAEYDRQNILEMEFFADDEKVTNKHRIISDPKIRARIFEATSEARKRAKERIATHPRDRDALLALCMATGIESDYSILIEKRYLRSFSLSKESQGYARTLLSLNPPSYDAYLTLGSVEYTVGSMNWFFKLFVHFDQIEGSKRKGMENLEKVANGGRYYKPLAKILLAVIYLRENQPQKSLQYMQELAKEFPQNPLAQTQIAKLTEKINRSRKTGK